MSDYSDVILAETGLQSYWRLGEASGSFADSKGSVSGTPPAVGLTRQQQSLLPKYDTDQACYFDRSFPGYIDFGDNYDFAGTANYTIEFLLKPVIVDSSPNYAYAKVNGTTGHAIDFWNGGWRAQRWDNAGVADTAYSAVAFTANRTYHLAVTYDGSNIKIYQNGAILSGATIASTRSITDHVGNFFLGAEGAGVSTGCTAWIDEFAVYNIDIGAATIAAHYSVLTSTAPSIYVPASMKVVS